MSFCRERELHFSVSVCGLTKSLAHAIVAVRRLGGMVDTADSKSAVLADVRVQVSQPVSAVL